MSDATRPEHRLSRIDEEARTAWCQGCRARVDLNGKPGRLVCGPQNRANAKAWREANPERAIATKEAYRAADPEKYAAMRLAASRRYADAHRQEMRDGQNARREKWRSQVIEAYGSRCNCPGCHVVHAELLTVDHVNGDGAEHRRSLGKSTRDMYWWIVKNGFPDDFQLLCGSCNMAKRDKDKCPLAGHDH